MSRPCFPSHGLLEAGRGGRCLRRGVQVAVWESRGTCPTVGLESSPLLRGTAARWYDVTPPHVMLPVRWGHRGGDASPCCRHPASQAAGLVTPPPRPRSRQVPPGAGAAAATTTRTSAPCPQHLWHLQATVTSPSLDQATLYTPPGRLHNEERGNSRSFPHLHWHLDLD